MRFPEIACLFPKNGDDLADRHIEISHLLETRLFQFGEEIAFAFGEKTARDMMRGFCVGHQEASSSKIEEIGDFEELGWRKYFNEVSTKYIDYIEITQRWRDCLEYAGQGNAPREPRELSSLSERQKRIEMLISWVMTASKFSSNLMGHECDYILCGALARAALDFKGMLSIEGLHLLSGLAIPLIRNAVSSGELHPDHNGKVSSDEANAWLIRRREFCPSRWKNLNDDQYSFERGNVGEANERGMTLVPQAGDGETFIPDLVVRSARGGTGISITIGAKGEEVQHDDFYQALVALSMMPVARWRRRNAAGNWGIVRARGAWVAVSKTDIDRQLVEKTERDR